MSAELAAAEDRLAGLEAEATLLKGRIRTAADAGNLDETVRLYQRIGSLRVELLAVRHVVARLTRRETRQYGFNSRRYRAPQHAHLWTDSGASDGFRVLCSGAALRCSVRSARRLNVRTSGP